MHSVFHYGNNTKVKHFNSKNILTITIPKVTLKITLLKICRTLMYEATKLYQSKDFQ